MFQQTEIGRWIPYSWHWMSLWNIIILQIYTSVDFVSIRSWPQCETHIGIVNEMKWKSKIQKVLYEYLLCATICSTLQHVWKGKNTIETNKMWIYKQWVKSACIYIAPLKCKFIMSNDKKKFIHKKKNKKS